MSPDDLIAAAAAARVRAYVPYSGYPVGAAILGAGGGVFAGCNVENAAFPQGQCAEANAIGTTYLRAQLLPEPVRGESLDLLRSYTDLAIELADAVPDTDEFDAAAAAIETLQQQLWQLAGDAMAADPQGSAPRLYVETLNDTIDRHTDRLASLRNRVPGTVMMIEVLGSAVALGVLALYLTMLGRGLTTSLLAAGVVVLILFVSFDLDRPQRGLINVPFQVLVDARASMDGEPAYAP